MSRIEEALRRLQGLSTVQAKPATLLATEVSREHDYGGRRIAIDTEQLKALDLLAPNSDERHLAEEYRVIKRPIVRNADPTREPVVPNGNLVMVASALPGEGKTFTCLNICLGIAREKDWRVVLVDGDCVKPHITRLFSAEREPGLIDLLRDPSLHFDSLVMPTDVPGLSFMPAGTFDQHGEELLASDRMHQLCTTLSSADARRMVVFDSSPLLLSTEAIALSAHVGQVVFVVRADSTPRAAVQAALAKLDASKAIGCVLNGAQAGDIGPAYGDYHHYGSSFREAQ